MRRAFRILRVGGVVIALVATLGRTAGGEGTSVPDAAACPGSGQIPRPAAVVTTRATIVCLLNAERAKHGLVPLSHHPLLELSSQRHSEDMAARDYFAHKTPDGADPRVRMNAAGYVPAWNGENLYWGSGVEATPVRAMRGWMNSPGHRENILRPQFTEVGVGISYEAPKRGVTDRVAVYTTNFGGPPAP